MRKRRLRVVIGVVGAACVGMALWLGYANTLSREIDQAACEGIALGMTERDVGEYLGAEPALAGMFIVRGPNGDELHTAKEWWGQDCVLRVTFNSAGVVVDKLLEQRPPPEVPQEPNIFARVSRKLRRLLPW